MIIFGILFFVLFGIPAIIGMILYIVSGDWKKGKVIHVPYKELNK